MGAIGNIDVDTSSATAMSTFHGTAASLHQKIPQKDAIEQRNVTTEFSTNKKLKKFPDYYIDIPAAYLPSKIKMAETTQIAAKASKENGNGIENDKQRLTFDRNVCTENAQNVSWAAFHATHTERSPICTDLSVLLPIWREPSKPPALTKNSMRVTAKAIKFLNPGQTPRGHV